MGFVRHAMTLKDFFVVAYTLKVKKTCLTIKLIKDITIQL